MLLNANGVPQYTKLEDRLVLLAWLNSMLGYAGNRELLDDIKKADEGFDATGRSHIYHRLISRGSQLKIPVEDLELYDGNIRTHLTAINTRRDEPITLRYFQYLATLYTEIVLDRYFNHRTQLLKILNAYVRERNASKLPGEPADEPFTESDLTKLAYWMATGSGKTLLLHLNYHQFLFYNTEPLENIILITPNEGLSEQHLFELKASSIPAQHFDLNHSSLWAGNKNAVQVIEITKLVEEKRGGGVSVPVEAFEGRNLIFVDEGHKGSGGEAWRGYRDALGATGFTFEYSATFGQALSASRNDPLTAEYGKAILFDYSYRYFYGDGYGKDFRILNLRDETDEGKTELLLLGNLLSFYEQQRVFEEQAKALRLYNLEKPLWVFVGSTVIKSAERRSDVLTVARFLHHMLENRRGWVAKGIEKLLAGRSGLVTLEGMDLFAGRFQYLRDYGMTPQAMFEDILERLFHAPAGSGLHLCDIRGAEGELGLKASGAEDYFGLIYIGDTAEFKKLVESDGAGITLEEDVFSSSLFDRINRPDTTIHILIGAKKFMEGWNSWRVSNMGLLNIGRQEGSQIIQLFGRGVRLRGKEYSLKRSAALPGDHPSQIKLLETLNIFAVRANYMAQFRDYLEHEGVDTEPTIELPLFVWANEQFLQRGLVVPRPEDGRDFAIETDLLLMADPKIRIRVDMSVKVQTMESSAVGLQEANVHAGQEQPIPPESLALVDWEQAYLDLLAYKERKGWKNLVIRPETLSAIVGGIRYTIAADETTLRPATFEGRVRLQEAVTILLCKYLDVFYRIRHEQWDSNHLVYRQLDSSDPNLAFHQPNVQEERAAYSVRVPHSRQKEVKAIQKLIQDRERLLKGENDNLPRIYFDRHLYLPLLLKRGEWLSANPPALEESEERFVRDLKAYWEAEKEKILKGKEVFLLRNLSRGKGVGFFEESGFYPDFILWIVDGLRQHIIFIEPHGLIHAGSYVNDDKAHLHERLPALAAEIGQRSGRQDITLDSYLISATPYDDLYRRYDDGSWDRKRFTQCHILFPERRTDYDYMALLFQGYSPIPGEWSVAGSSAANKKYTEK